LDDWVSENLSIAESASEKGLCDHCLGRLFGKLGKGMTNGQRSLMLREALGSKGISCEVPEYCSLCDNVFDIIERLADAAAESIVTAESDNFVIGSRVDPETVKKEKALWEELGVTGSAEPMKSEMNREIGKLVAARTGRSAEFGNPQIVACVDTRFADVTLDIAPVFIYGRYNKLSREIPQTIWPCRTCRGKGCGRCGGKGKMYETSVQEIIGDTAVRM
jgi:tRNA pseudouridine synthase 10